MNIVLAADSAGVGPISLSGCGDLQRLKQLGDEMSDTTLALSTTCDAVKRLSEGYAQYGVGNDAQCKAQIGENEDVYYQLMEHSRELDWLLQQTDGLRQKLLRTSQLVWNGTLGIVRVILTSRQVSSFMDLGNGRSLEDLGKEARIENTQIHEMTKKSTQDAAAVKILTIMMLVYLPATVVLVSSCGSFPVFTQLINHKNFFSTSFVNSDTSPGSSGHLIILKNWWIVVIISVPLTVLTLYVWWVFTGIQTNGTYPRWWNMIAKQNLLLIRRKTLSTDEESNIRPTSTESAMGVGTEKL